MRIRILVGLMALALVATACGDDGDDGAASTTTRAGAGQVLNLNATATGLTGLPGQVNAGVVTVRLTAAGDLDSPDFELEFSRVTAGTTDAAFKAGLAPLLGGGPFPEFFLDNAGVGVGEFAIELKAGSYFVWFEAGGDDDGDDSAPPEVVTTTLTVAAGTSGGEFPATDGTITATDYTFDIDVRPGDSFKFVNRSTVQFHHAIVLDFGSLDLATVEANLPAFMTAEEDDPPPAPFANLDFDEVFAGGGSGVFGPGSTGTAAANFRSGSTYAVVCFIQDRAGGPPHAIAHKMYKVFRVA